MTNDQCQLLIQALERQTEALRSIAAHLEGLRSEGIVVWGGCEPEAN